MAKKQYVTDGYIEEVEHYLNNNLDIQDLYKESNSNLKLVEELLDKDEKYIRLEGNLDHYCITSYARIFNIDRINQLSVQYLNKEQIIIYLLREKHDFEVIFEEQAWNFDIKEIIKRYDQRGWSYKKLNYRKGV